MSSRASCSIPTFTATSPEYCTTDQADMDVQPHSYPWKALDLAMLDNSLTLDKYMSKSVQGCFEAFRRRWALGAVDLAHDFQNAEAWNGYWAAICTLIARLDSCWEDVPFQNSVVEVVESHKVSSIEAHQADTIGMTSMPVLEQELKALDPAIIQIGRDAKPTTKKPSTTPVQALATPPATFIYLPDGTPVNISNGVQTHKKKAKPISSSGCSKFPKQTKKSAIGPKQRKKKSKGRNVALAETTSLSSVNTALSSAGPSQLAEEMSKSLTQADAVSQRPCSTNCLLIPHQSGISKHKMTQKDQELRLIYDGLLQKFSSKILEKNLIFYFSLSAFPSDIQRISTHHMARKLQEFLSKQLRIIEVHPSQLWAYILPKLMALSTPQTQKKANSKKLLVSASPGPLGVNTSCTEPTVIVSEDMSISVESSTPSPIESSVLSFTEPSEDSAEESLIDAITAPVEAAPVLKVAFEGIAQSKLNEDQSATPSKPKAFSFDSHVEAPGPIQTHKKRQHEPSSKKNKRKSKARAARASESSAPPTIDIAESSVGTDKPLTEQAQVPKALSIEAAFDFTTTAKILHSTGDDLEATVEKVHNNDFSHISSDLGEGNSEAMFTQPPFTFCSSEFSTTSYHDSPAQSHAQASAEPFQFGTSECKSQSSSVDFNAAQEPFSFGTSSINGLSEASNLEPRQEQFTFGSHGVNDPLGSSGFRTPEEKYDFGANGVSGLPLPSGFKASEKHYSFGGIGVDGLPRPSSFEVPPEPFNFGTSGVNGLPRSSSLGTPGDLFGFDCDGGHGAPQSSDFGVPEESSGLGGNPYDNQRDFPSFTAQEPRYDFGANGTNGFYNPSSNFNAPEEQYNYNANGTYGTECPYNFVDAEPPDYDPETGLEIQWRVPEDGCGYVLLELDDALTDDDIERLLKQLDDEVELDVQGSVVDEPRVLQKLLTETAHADACTDIVVYRLYVFPRLAVQYEVVIPLCFPDITRAPLCHAWSPTTSTGVVIYSGIEALGVKNDLSTNLKANEISSPPFIQAIYAEQVAAQLVRHSLASYIGFKAHVVTANSCGSNTRAITSKHNKPAILEENVESNNQSTESTTAENNADKMTKKSKTSLFGKVWNLATLPARLLLKPAKIFLKPAMAITKSTHKKIIEPTVRHIIKPTVSNILKPLAITAIRTTFYCTVYWLTFNYRLAELWFAWR